MDETAGNKPKKRICAGILAHVDAGKTTLSEAMLFTSGNIRRMGRVDNQDAFLDTYELERARGITIFSKQALLTWDDLEITLLDTPGHVDFSAEMERTLQVLDYAILVVSGADGVQGHTQTLWRLLNRYQIPVFIFVNKMDQNGTDHAALAAQLQERLDGGCVDFTYQGSGEFYDALAMCGEEAMEQFLEKETVEPDCIRDMIQRREVFPCFFGSALKLQGVRELLEGFAQYIKIPRYPQEFAAKAFKIARDEQGNRLTYLKITGGFLEVRSVLSNAKVNAKANESAKVNGKASASEKIKANVEVNTNESAKVNGNPKADVNAKAKINANEKYLNSQEIWEEKVTGIRIYSGAKFEAVNNACAGTVCAVTGLTQTKPGEGFGAEPDSGMPLLEPVLTYQIILPEGCDAAAMLPKLRQIEEEEPELHIVWDEQLQEIQAQLMGEVQLEIITSMIKERFGIAAEFGAGNIVYKETIADSAEGVGHFEPLRHYAEVHLLLEPGEEGSGMQFAADCSEDILDRNWQRLVLTHLEEREHKGVLTGSVLTDVKITLITGRAHLKHTEGGDFRQATYRAVRQGLMQAQSVLLEPYYEFRLELPEAMVGRAMTDIEKMHGHLGLPEIENGISVLTGSAPAATMRGYQKEVTEYTRGMGQLQCTLKGYAPCHNAEEVIERIGYEPERDLANPAASVFCAHGAGFLVEWYEVKDYMHVESPLAFQKPEALHLQEEAAKLKKRASAAAESIGTDEVDEIIARTQGANKRDKSVSGKNAAHKKRVYDSGKTAGSMSSEDPAAHQSGQGRAKLSKRKEYFLVDGYNIIFAWKELSAIAKDNIDGARGRLLDIMCNYQALKKYDLIVVFDAYRVEGHQTEYYDYHNIHVVFTKEAETADQYIERFAHENGRKYNVTVATSDGLEQIIIRGQGCRLVSARELEEETAREFERLNKEYIAKQPRMSNMPFGEALEKRR